MHACLPCVAAIAMSLSSTTGAIAGPAGAAAGPGDVVVHTALHGFILGYDIDQGGTEGLLSEAVQASGETFDVATETFDVKTGAIVRILRKEKATYDDYVTLGLYGSHVGLVEWEKADSIYVKSRRYLVIDPLDGNRVTGTWTPPLGRHAVDIITGTAESQGSGEAVFMGMYNTGTDFSSYVFKSNVATDRSGKVFQVKDTRFNWSLSPVVALDEVNDKAVLGGSNGCFGCTTEIARVDLQTGEMDEFEGLGYGTVNGIAFDSGTSTACTATEDDFSVEFYDFRSGIHRIATLPGADSQAQSGVSISVDLKHHLFLIAQLYSSTASSGSSIQVFDEKGNFVESLNGFQFPRDHAIRMALDPATRTGFVFGDPSMTTLRSFSY